MKLAVDLHIHSCLSPCAEDDMTPNNIICMAKIKGLDAIAITDHNSAANLATAQSIAQREGMLLLPGLEVQSREEVHLLCYFERFEQAIEFGEHVYGTLLPIPNNSKLFGRQIMMNENDEEMGELKNLLIQSSSLGIKQIAELVREQGGVVVPAHINRTSNSLLASLGFIPPEMDFKTVEIYSGLPAPDLDGYRKVFSSDAHDLGSILEREFFIEVKQPTVNGILSYLRKEM